MNNLENYIANLPRFENSDRKKELIMQNEPFVLSERNIDYMCEKCMTKVPSTIINIYVPNIDKIAKIKYGHIDSNNPIETCNNYRLSNIKDKNDISEILVEEVYKIDKSFNQMSSIQKLTTIAKIEQSIKYHISEIIDDNEISKKMDYVLEKVVE
jgi:hypothetical protein